MYSDLFDHLGSNAGGGSGNSGSSNSNEKQLVSFKAGKMDLTLQENGKYWAAPDTRRGEIRIVWKTSDSSLYWEWYDRREKSVADADRHVLFSVGGTTSDLGTMERVTEVPNAAPQDRLVVWTRPQAGGSNSNYHMYWLQDASEEKDDEVIAQVNQYLSDPASANPSTGSSSGGGASSSNDRASGNASNNAAAETSSSSTDRQQVDALSNILENLGMPQNEASSGGASAAASSSNNRPTGTLTLADLQGAMAGIQGSATSGPPGPPLQEIVTPAAIQSLLENEAVKNRLLELLPEEQRSEEFLADNLRSPQVQQTLRSLTAALLPDDTGSMDGYHSVLANFSMAEGAQDALENNSNNPIQAFLECVLKSVEKEEGKEEEGKSEESKE